MSIRPVLVARLEEENSDHEHVCPKIRTRRLSSARSAFLRGRALPFSGYSPVLDPRWRPRFAVGIPSLKRGHSWRPPRFRGNLWVPRRRAVSLTL